jgi:ATP-dependent Clp protease ATP-binding subunit ClpC
MSKKNESNYTIELNGVLDYMSTVLLNEFPTDVLTPEYLILAILDTKDCHANLILDNCLMSNNIEELRRVYVEVIDKHIKPQLKDGNVKFNDELVRILDCAKIESEKLNNSQVGTEHVLLAILNKENNFNEESVFDKFMLQYEFIFNKCNINTQLQDNEPKANKLKPKKISKARKDIPLKSQVNTKTVANIASSDSPIELYATSLNNLAKNGKIDEIIGRDEEVKEIIKVLSRRKKNNAILVGKGGVGKTAIVYGIAKMIEDGKVPSVLEGKEIVMLNQMALVSGTHFRGMFEERMKALIDTLQANDKYILFIDDIHTVVKSGSKEKDGDISGMIGNLLSEGTVKVIATTTFKEYRNAIESNTQLSRKLQKIVIEPTSIDDTIKILLNNKKYYEDYHGVRYGEKTIEKAVKLAERYITDRSLPDSAFDIIDLAGAKTALIDREPIEIQNTKKRMRQIEDEKNEALNNGDFEKIDSLTIEEMC